MTQPDAEFLDFQAALAGEYSLQRELGRGGMGIVYLARDVQLDREVAIKVLPAHLARTAESRDRFVREARTAAGLSHPNIVPIHRVGEAGGFVFFVMSYVEGETLGERLRARGPLPPADAMRILREVAWALAYAHGRGIVHRDVKPDNILLEANTGRALVTDFGIAHVSAHASAQDRPVTDPGRIMGTAHFMSPEQAANQPVDGRSDLYSLGVVGYLAVSGRLPFEAASVPALLVRQATEAPTSVLRVAPALPSALGAAIDRCLAREPDARFADGEALAAALAPPVDARPPLPPMLRSWLGSRNAALGAYTAWSGIFTVATLGQLAQMIGRNQFTHVQDMLMTFALAVAPLIPIVGYHLNQARRLFRVGHTLADLRFALDLASRERLEGEELVVQESLRRPQALLRLATYGAVGSSGLVIVLGMMGQIRNSPVIVMVPFISTIALGALCNALEVSLVPRIFRNPLQQGLRERLWRSRLGAWVAQRLGAPDRSRAVGGSVFRATEAALGVAASELLAALPKAYRAQLADLPGIVVALEARAAEARAEIDVLSALAPSGSVAADVLEQRRGAASAHLAESVAALEGIRLDLLRLHAGAGDLAPLTTLIDAARLLGEDVSRLADGRREADGAATRRIPAARRAPTPA